MLRQRLTMSPAHPATLGDLRAALDELDDDTPILIDHGGELWEVERIDDAARAVWCEEGVVESEVEGARDVCILRVTA